MQVGIAAGSERPAQVQRDSGAVIGAQQPVRIGCADAAIGAAAAAASPLIVAILMLKGGPWTRWTGGARPAAFTVCQQIAILKYVVGGATFRRVGVAAAWRG